MHLKRLDDQARDDYNANLRRMAQAQAQTNLQQFAQRQSSDNDRRQYEINRDNTDLNKVNASTLRPSATLSAGTTAQFK